MSIEQELEKMELRKRFNPLCSVICPEDLPDLDEYCREVKVNILHCYGYGRSYCPRICTYAKEMKVKNGEKREIKK